MDIQTVIEGARAGRYAPVHVLVGTERFLIERAIALLKHAAVGESIPGFNDDILHGDSTTANAILHAAKTLPMLAKARYVLVRDVDAMDNAELDVLAAYLDSPSPSTCLVLCAEKIDGRTRLARAAKDGDFLAEAMPLKGHAV